MVCLLHLLDVPIRVFEEALELDPACCDNFV